MRRTGQLRLKRSPTLTLPPKMGEGSGKFQASFYEEISGSRSIAILGRPSATQNGRGPAREGVSRCGGGVSAGFRSGGPAECSCPSRRAIISASTVRWRAAPGPRRVVAVVEAHVDGVLGGPGDIRGECRSLWRMASLSAT